MRHRGGGAPPHRRLPSSCGRAVRGASSGQAYNVSLVFPGMETWASSSVWSMTLRGPCVRLMTSWLPTYGLLFDAWGSRRKLRWALASLMTVTP